MQLKGTFQITDWQESVEKSFEDGSKLSAAKVYQDYSGDISGKSEINYQMSYDINGDADFVGFECIEGNIANKSCTLILQHHGCFQQGVAKSNFVIIRSCQQALIGKAGKFSSGQGGQASFVID